MSDIDASVEQSQHDTTLMQPKEGNTLKPLYRQFSLHFVSLFIMLMLIIGLVGATFYHQSAAKQTLVEKQLIPIKQQLKHLQVLQTADALIEQLLDSHNSENYTKLHAQLITVNQQLLQINDANVQRYQQWLNENKQAVEIVARIQDNQERNEQLRQNSIIQLQLMLFSLRSKIDKQTTDFLALDKQLQAKQAKRSVTFNNASEYAQRLKELNALQAYQALVGKLLESIEQLSMRTPIASFELLRLNADQAIAQNNRLKQDKAQRYLTDVFQQMETFEKIIFSEQRALSKWQGYIRLAHDYHGKLKVQQQKIRQILLQPHSAQYVNTSNYFEQLLSKLGFSLTDKQIQLILMTTICLMLLFLSYSLWRLKLKIKTSILQSVNIIKQSLQAQPENSIRANCEETQIILQQLQHIAKPTHSEQAYQALAAQYQANQQLLAQKSHTIAQLQQDLEQQKHVARETVDFLLTTELQCYQYLAQRTLLLIQQQQGLVFNESNFNAVNITEPLVKLYQHLKQFELSVQMQSETSVLVLNDINLIDEIHSILFNKALRQPLANHQFLITCDEQLATLVKIDLRLFEQLISLLLDICLENYQGIQVSFDVQLKDKREGQQIVNFGLKVKHHLIKTLPDVIKQLLITPANTRSPLISAFNVLFAKHHGDNLFAQLIDGGYQVVFELPLANSTQADITDKLILDNIKVMMLSDNLAISSIVKNSIRCAKGKFEQLAGFDQLQQQIDADNLKCDKVDVLVVASDMVEQHLDAITSKIHALPQRLQPKLMVLQSPKLSYKHFGFYSQSEQLFCKTSFLSNINALLSSDHTSNQLLPAEAFKKTQYLATQLQVLLAVHSPAKYQPLQRLLSWLGLQVQVVAHKALQQAQWQSGQYSILITEFAETALLEMEHKPLINIAVISLTAVIPQSENSQKYNQWHLGTLTKDSTLAELSQALAPWLKPLQPKNHKSAIKVSTMQANKEQSIETPEDFMITEVANIYREKGADKVFDFAQYLHHQGTAELALCMLDDYTQDNHQQLDNLMAAIKAHNIEAAQLAVAALALNGDILCAQTLKRLCAQWSNLLNSSKLSNCVDNVDVLYQETCVALQAIDEYAETV